jgi:hypothetical protein
MTNGSHLNPMVGRLRFRICVNLRHLRLNIPMVREAVLEMLFEMRDSLTLCKRIAGSIIRAHPRNPWWPFSEDRWRRHLPE